MKILFILLLIPFACVGQTKRDTSAISILYKLIGQNVKIKDTGDTFTYQEIIKADSISKAELFNRARKWVQVAFTDPSAVITSEDSVAGIMTCICDYGFSADLKGVSQQLSGSTRLIIEFKNGKYRYAFSDIKCDFDGSEADMPTWRRLIQNKDMGSFAKDVHDKIIGQLFILATSLKNHMKEKYISDNW